MIRVTRSSHLGAKKKASGNPLRRTEVTKTAGRTKPTRERVVLGGGVLEWNWLKEGGQTVVMFGPDGEIEDALSLDADAYRTFLGEPVMAWIVSNDKFAGWLDEVRQLNAQKRSNS